MNLWMLHKASVSRRTSFRGRRSTSLLVEERVSSAFGYVTEGFIPLITGKLYHIGQQWSFLWFLSRLGSEIVLLYHIQLDVYLIT